MDIYQQVIVKLYETSGGKETLAIDLKDLVKKLGLYGHYARIFDRLSQEGWVAEDRKADFVRITHWGIAEAKKNQVSAEGNNQSENHSVNAEHCANLAKEFIVLVENFGRNSSEENWQKAQAKFEDIETAFNLAKNDIR